MLCGPRHDHRLPCSPILTAQRTVSAKELCEKLNVTAVTIFRDLEELEQEGVVVRSHGASQLRRHRLGELLQRVRRRARSLHPVDHRRANPLVLDSLGQSALRAQRADRGLRAADKPLQQVAHPGSNLRRR